MKLDRISGRHRIEFMSVANHFRAELGNMQTSMIFLLVFFAGCQYDPYTEVYATRQPGSNDMVGVYDADTNTLDLISKKGHYLPVHPSITLENGGTIIISNIPDWWLIKFGEPHGGFDSGRGTWTIQKSQKWWVLGVEFTNTEQFSSQNHKSGGLSTEMMLIGEKPPYKIHLTVGDADAGIGMQFVRLLPEKTK